MEEGGDKEARREKRKRRERRERREERREKKEDRPGRGALLLLTPRGATREPPPP